MRHLLTMMDLNRDELEQILVIAEQVKQLHAQGRRPAWLARNVLAMLFEKPSLRTRVSFEAGICHLGGTAMFLGQEVGWQSRESTADFIRVLAQYADFVVCRAKHHRTVEELAAFNVVPIINGLTDAAHPCQALADLMTMRAAGGDLEDKIVAFVGDGNNVARSLAVACAMVGARFHLVGPRKYFIPQEIVARIRERYQDAEILQTEVPETGLSGADFIYTDVWTSMGQEAESARRRKDFAPYQVNRYLLEMARPECRVLHCLPAKRGEEITDEVMESPNSLVIEQAGNRMHAQKGLLLWLAMQEDKLTAADLEREGIHLKRPLAT
ncbi:MAG: ornithine carbamoyltransferase [Planctomycetota bacterium]|nr:MAG: ornithine carbamoyltransferase [Planctomycetota bacterium]